MIAIRPYQPSDAPKLWQLLFNTVHHINKKDYNDAQINAWAPEEFDMDLWQQRVDKNQPFIATFDNTIVGFADLQEDGLIDHFFIDHLYQGQRVGTTLMLWIHIEAQKRGIHLLYADVSITAKPFFQHHGFALQTEQYVTIRGQKFRNFRMEKSL